MALVGRPGQRSQGQRLRQALHRARLAAVDRLQRQAGAEGEAALRIGARIDSRAGQAQLRLGDHIDAGQRGGLDESDDVVARRKQHLRRAGRVHDGLQLRRRQQVAAVGGVGGVGGGGRAARLGQQDRRGQQQAGGNQRGGKVPECGFGHRADHPGQGQTPSLAAGGRDSPWLRSWRGAVGGVVPICDRWAGGVARRSALRGRRNPGGPSVGAVGGVAPTYRQHSFREPFRRNSL